MKRIVYLILTSLILLGCQGNSIGNNDENRSKSDPLQKLLGGEE